MQINKNIVILNNYDEKDKFIKTMLKNIHNINDKLEQGAWFYIITCISHCNMISYKKNAISSVTFSEKALSSFLKKSHDIFNNLRKYSSFIKSIKINNINIVENYHKISNNIDSNTVVYIDSHYYGINTNKIYYSNFNPMDQIDLNLFVNNISKKNILVILSNSDNNFINNLYNNFNIYKHVIKTNINSSKIRNELIITNFHHDTK